MTFVTEKKRASEADALNSLKSQIVNSVAVLKGAQTNLAALKAKLNADGDFSAEDEAEVQTVLDLIDTEIAKI